MVVSIEATLNCAISRRLAHLRRLQLNGRERPCLGAASVLLAQRSFH